MKIRPADYRVGHHEDVDLGKRPTRVEPLYASKDDYQELLRAQVQRLSALQELHYADHRHALLLVFQGMDAAGKDSAIKQVMSGVNPQGCQVFSFKQPSSIDLDHDFLWRTYACLPRRGHIGIFNRSYYEDVLIVRVHPEYLLAQGVKAKDTDKAFWRGRFHSIAEMERHLDRNGTQVIKFYLHISKKEQRERLLGRIDDPRKNWKFSMADIAERKFWKGYRDAYEECMGATSTEFAPWYVVPADDKPNARLIVSQIVLDALESLKLKPPKVTDAERAELQEIRKVLEE